METKIGVVIPCYKVRKHIMQVIAKCGDEVWRIYVVDDCCPDESGKYIEHMIDDSRVRVLYHEQNQGVGGAVMTGYRTAITDGAEIIVKIDGDGQMDPRLILNRAT
jgi:dolichol-phosphate mannosyltransferase